MLDNDDLYLIGTFGITQYIVQSFCFFLEVPKGLQTSKSSK